MAKVSIIVPIYNQQEGLKRCLDSLMQQTLQDLEIILVNDGSTDKSPEICRRYQMKDHRFIVIDQTNQGVSKARNHGLSAATGDFIGFVDSDDWVEPIMFETMLADCLRTNSEVAICNYFIDRGASSHPVRLELTQERLTKAEIFADLILNMLAADVQKPGQKPIRGGCFRLLVRKNLLDRYSLEFPLGIRYMEDLIFSVRLLSKTSQVCISHGCLYHYSVSLSSASKKYIPQLFEHLFQIMDLLMEILNEEGLAGKAQTRFSFRTVFSGIRAIANEAHPANPKACSEQLRTIRTICSDVRIQRALHLPEYRSGSLQQQLVYYAIRHRLELLLWIIFRINYRNFKHQTDRESLISY